MTTFLATLFAVSILLALAVPGFLFIKCKLVKEDFIPGVSKILLYVCQPAIAIYSFQNIEFSYDVLRNLGLFTLFCIAIHAIILLSVYFLLGKNRNSVLGKIVSLSSCFANCTFFGIPLIEAIFPEEAPGLIVYAALYALILNIFGWTAGAAILSGDTKFISVKRICLNPTTLGTVAAFLLLAFSITLPETLLSHVTIVGKMATPLSMLVLGMRLATADLKSIFLNGKLYIASFVKLVAMPVVSFLLIYFIPISPLVKASFFILGACPTASLALAFAEMFGEGQKEASASILLSTILSIATLPLLAFMMELF